MRTLGWIVLLSALCLPASSRARSGFSVSLFGGLSLTPPLPLRIVQEGEPDLQLQARWATESFQYPFYYDVRVGYSREKLGWELEMLHDKLVLKNLPPEVQLFRVSHGYNRITANQLWNPGPVLARFGLGVVIAHPENVVRGEPLPTGGFFGLDFYLSGVTAQIAAERCFFIVSGFFAAPEIKLTASWARVPVARGYADVPCLALHLLVGLGYDWAQ